MCKNDSCFYYFTFSAIAADEKEYIKVALCNSYTLCQRQSSKQAADSIARIVRLEPVGAWPELPPVLLEGVQSSNVEIQQKSLLMLLHVIKALSSRSTLREKRFFETFVGQIFQMNANIWLVLLQTFMSTVQEGKSIEEVNNVLERAVLSLKIMKKMSIFGMFHPGKNELMREYLNSLLPAVDELLKCRLFILSKPEYQQLVEPTEKYLTKHMKLLFEFQEKYIVEITDMTPMILNFAYDHVFGTKVDLILSGNRVNFPGFAIHAFNLIKTQLGYDDKVPKYNVEVDMKMVKVTDGFFQTDKVEAAMSKLLNTYLVLTEVELNNWNENPEEFIAEECGDSWKYTMRGSAEAIFMMLCKCYTPAVTHCLEECVYQAQHIPPTATPTLEMLLFKDAVYNAIGLASFKLFDEIDFDEWFTQSLVPELLTTDPAYKIVRRRGIWLVGKWTDVKFNKLLRPKVYEMCGILLKSSEDVVVRLTASQTLKTVMEDFDFCPDTFLPYLEHIFMQLYSLLKEVEECESKMNILKIMSFIIEKMSRSIRDHANDLVGYLPILWNESGENYLLKTVILSTMREIINALGGIPDVLITFIYSVLTCSTNVEDDLHVYLIDEGLELWLKTLHFSKECNDVLLQLAKNLFPVIESSSSYLQTCLHIMQSYVLLTPEFFLHTYGAGIVNGFQQMQGDMRSEGVIMINTLYVLMMKTLPDVAIPILKPAFVDAMKAIYSDSAFISITCIYISLVCRLLVTNRMAFIEYLQELNVPDAFEKIFESILERFGHMQARKEDQKLVALAIMSIITEQNDTIYLKFETILDKLNIAMANVVLEDRYTHTKSDCLLIDDQDQLGYDELADAEAFDVETPHFERLQKVGLRDPVHTVPLHGFLQSQLEQICGALGMDKYTELLRTVDESILVLTSSFVNIGITLPNSSNSLED